MTHRYTVSITETAPSGVFPPHKKAEDPSVWARREIISRSKVENRVSFFYKDTLRFLISKLGTLGYINSEDKVTSVRCIHAHPERTISKLKEETNIILPIISISQNTSDNDDKRRRNSPVLINEKYWSDVKKRAFRVLSLAPRPVNIKYSVNIWSKYKSNLDQLAEQIRLLFNPHLVIENMYTNTVQSYITSELDRSSVNVGDRQDRIIRRSFDIDVEGYVPNPKFLITSTGEIEVLNADVEIY
tara:strand:- start:296 stop:1027 length:732 start_codon:yes stop_codon:yes gene_type:complete